MCLMAAGLTRPPLIIVLTKLANLTNSRLSFYRYPGSRIETIRFPGPGALSVGMRTDLSKLIKRWMQLIGWVPPAWSARVRLLLLSAPR